MTTAKRTGDDEERIVHGGELPEDDGSLDDVVVDDTPRKKPEELWTSYLIRRLSAEGIFLGEFEKDKTIDEPVRIKLYQELNSGFYLRIVRHADTNKVTELVSSKGNKESFNLNELVCYESISLLEKDTNENDFKYALCFCFNHSEFTVKAVCLTEEPEFRQLPFICNYYPFQECSAEQIITDLVKYIKETGIKK